MLQETTAAILVGGLGTRLRPVVADRPKPLAEVAGRPFLDRLLDQLVQAGVRRAVLLTGHLGERVEAHYGPAHGELALTYSREETPLGTGGALRLALPLLGPGPTLLMNGDSFVDVELGQLAAHHQGGATLTLVEVPDTSRYGRVELAGERVTSFLEKGAAGGPGWINAGVTLIDRELIAALPEGAFALEREALPAWAAAGRLRGLPTRGRFIDIGTPETYAEGQHFFEP